MKQLLPVQVKGRKPKVYQLEGVPRWKSPIVQLLVRRSSITTLGVSTSVREALLPSVRCGGHRKC